MARRTLRTDFAAAGAHMSNAWGGAPGWVAGAVTGVQAAALSLLAVLAVALVAVAAAPTPDGSVTVDWAGASSAAVAFWLLAFGAPVVAGGAVVDLAPLGLTAGIAAITYVLAQRFTAPRPGSVAIAGASLGAVVAIVAASTGSGVPVAVQSGLWAAAIGTVAAAAGVRRARGMWVLRAPRVPAVVTRAVRQGLAGVAAAYGVAAVLLVVGVVVGWSEMGRAWAALDADPVGVAVIGVGELAYVPTLVAWMLAWLTGIGFVVGSGSLYAPSELVAEPVPLVPIMAALPHAAGGPLVWAPTLLILVGLVARLARGPRSAATRETLGATTLAAPVAAFAFALVTTLATGSIGTGHLTVVGADWLAVGPVAAGLLLAGGLLGEGVAWWRSVAATSRQAGRGRARATGRKQPPSTPRRTAPSPHS